MRLLHDVRPSYEERNSFLYMCMGLISVAERFDALLGECRSSPARAGDRGIRRTSESDDLLACALGLVSLRAALLAHLGEACLPNHVGMPPAVGDGAPVLESGPFLR